MIHALLFNLFTPTQWDAQQTANVISFFGSAGTVVALWYAFYRDRKQDKKISDLAIIATELRAQNQILGVQLRDDAAPKFEAQNAEANEQLVMLYLKNVGKKATINKFKVVDNSNVNVSLNTEIVRKDEDLRIMLDFKANGAEVTPYKVGFHYSDIYNNRYAFILTGCGNRVLSQHEYEVKEDSNF